jgi:sortase A
MTTTEVREGAELEVVMLESPAAEPFEAPQPRARPGLSAGTRTTLWMLVALALLSLWVVAYARVFSGIEQEAEQRRLYDQLREELARATAPVSGAIQPGAPVAIISAPSLGLDQTVVVEGTSADIMRSGPGHYRSSPLPGQVGTSYLFGRSVTFGGSFARIGELAPGDPLTITTGQGVFDFTVEQVRRPGDTLSPPIAPDESRVTLVTSEDSGVTRGWAADSVLYVDARLEGKAVEATGGVATSAPEQIMATTTATLVPLVLWLQLMLVVVVLWVLGVRRWGKWQSWMVAVPVFAACLWGATSAAFAFLPNLL